MRKPTRLKLAIVMSGRRQKDIAGALGMDEAHLSRIVNGLHCDDATRGRIAAEIGRKVSDCFEVDEAAAA